jgi:hypothetical protein
LHENTASNRWPFASHVSKSARTMSTRSPNSFSRRGERGEVYADLHRFHPQAALEERPSRVSRPGANLENTVTGPELGETDEFVEDLRWWDRPAGIVGSSVLVEGQPVLLTPPRGESRREFGVRHDPILALVITRRGPD